MLLFSSFKELQLISLIKTLSYSTVLLKPFPSLIQSNLLGCVTVNETLEYLSYILQTDTRNRGVRIAVETQNIVKEVKRG